MSADIAIRPAAFEDVAGIARVHVQTWNEAFRGMVPDWAIDRYTIEKRIEGWNKWLRRDGYVTFVAEDESGIIGFMNAFPDVSEPGFDSYLNTLYVLKSAQGRGIARKLLRAAAASLIAAGKTSMWWLTLRDNPACGFYERLGATLLREQPAPAELGEGTMDRVYGLRDLRGLL